MQDGSDPGQGDCHAPEGVGGIQSNATIVRSGERRLDMLTGVHFGGMLSSVVLLPTLVVGRVAESVEYS